MIYIYLPEAFTFHSSFCPEINTNFLIFYCFPQENDIKKKAYIYKSLAINSPLEMMAYWGCLILDYYPDDMQSS
jgi:hypothetical protein